MKVTQLNTNQLLALQRCNHLVKTALEQSMLAQTVDLNAADATQFYNWMHLPITNAEYYSAEAAMRMHLLIKQL